jgi:transcription initiation factor TFIIF subunit alpha
MVACVKLLLCCSVSEPEQLANKELKGVAEEDALRKLLSSGEEDEEEEEV